MVQITQILTLFLLFISSVIGSAQAQSIQTRVALVIGNSAYEDLPTLKNPANDAQTLATALAGIGFDVYIATDLKGSEFKSALDHFNTKSSIADVSLIYFAGHGASIGRDNILFPTDFNLTKDIKDGKFITVQDLQNAFSDNSSVNLIFFDACQEPLKIEFDDTLFELNSMSPKIPEVGTLMAFASTRGSAAYDGTAKHSLFTGALLDNLNRPDTDIDVLLKHIRRDVISNSQGKQNPQVVSSLISKFYFYPTKQSSLNTDNIGPHAHILVQNGFSEKPLLKELSKGFEAPEDRSQISARKESILTMICLAIEGPKPKKCAEILASSHRN